ncbi:MAG: hypothetical protein M5U34_27735 [Chloroflexi bacterium]|nr:hypothetical protein [Chloroflexota bacterium]
MGRIWANCWIFYSGRQDLRQGIIRVLHSLSFIDDPTRILRAVRYEQRLDFVIEPRTAELIADALPVLDRVTGDRIRHELELALREAAPVQVMARLHNLGVMQHIHPALTWNEETAVLYHHVPPFCKRRPGGKPSANIPLVSLLCPVATAPDGRRKRGGDGPPEGA